MKFIWLVFFSVMLSLTGCDNNLPDKEDISSLSEAADALAALSDGEGLVRGVVNLANDPRVRERLNNSVLMLAPGEINGAAQASPELVSQVSEGRQEESDVLPPVVEPIPIEIDASTGEFSVAVPADGDYSLVLVDESTNTGAMVADVAVTAGEETTQDITDSMLIDFGSIILNVIDEQTNSPIAVAVTLVETSEKIITTADNGIARFDQLPPGRYSLIIAQDGYANAQRSGVVSSNGLLDLGTIVLNKSRGNIVGQIETVDLDSQANITVYARSPFGDVFTTLTNPSGIYEFQAIPPGEMYTVIISANEYVAIKKNGVSVIANQTTVVDLIELRRSDAGLGGISGHAVFAEKHGSFEHAGIIVSVEGTDKEAITSRDGAYVINDLEPGDYTLNYTSSNHSTVTKAVKVVESTVRKLSLFQLNSVNGSLTGMVVDANHNPLSAANVTVLGLGDTTLTADDGSYSFASLSVGEYSVMFSKDGYATSHRNVTISQDSLQDLSATPIVLNSNFGSLVGRVIGNDELGLPGVLVAVKDFGVSVVTGADGGFYFDQFPIGSYTLELSREGYISQQQGVTILRDQQLDLTASPIVMPMHIFTGTVSLSEGEADHSGVIVTLEGTGMTVQTVVNGTFEFQGVAPGNYQLQFVKSGFSTEMIAVSTVGVTEAYVLPYVVQLSREVGVIRGVATLEGQANHDGIQVELAGGLFSAVTNSLGEWRLTVPIGNYSGISYAKDRFVSAANSDNITVIEFGDNVAPAVQLQQTHATVNLNATAINNCSNVDVALNGVSGEAVGFSGSFTSGEQGYINFPNLLLGGYTAVISCADAGWETRLVEFSLHTGVLSVDLQPIVLRQSYIKINRDDFYTNNPLVDLGIGSTDAVQMRVREGASDSGWLAYLPDMSPSLSAADGMKTVTVDFLDANGLALPSVQDEIFLDTTIVVAGFEVTGASTKGDMLHLRLDLSGEPDAQVNVAIPGLIASLGLLDNGVGGDAAANDGIYERDLLITQPIDIDVSPVASIIDRAGNSHEEISSTPLLLSSAPTIRNLHVSSNVATGRMVITFNTDEPTTSLIDFGEDFASLTNNQSVHNYLTTSHEVTLNDLSASSVTYYRLTVVDAVGNEDSTLGQSKLAPAPVTGLNAYPGDDEIGVIWDKRNDVAGYNIYRSTDDGGSFYLVNQSGVIANNFYVDSLVVNMNSYHYRVTAVDDNGNESMEDLVADVTPDGSLAGPTDIAGGVLTENAVWLSSRSPYNVVENLKIGSGSELILFPGSSVTLEGEGRYIQIEGRLSGLGTESSLISIVSHGYYANGDPGTLSVVGFGEMELAYAELDDVDVRKETREQVVEIRYSQVNFDMCYTSRWFYAQGVYNSRFVRDYSSPSCYISNGSNFMLQIVDNSVITYSGDEPIYGSHLAVKKVTGSVIDGSWLSFFDGGGGYVEQSTLNNLVVQNPSNSSFVSNQFNDVVFNYSDRHIHSSIGLTLKRNVISADSSITAPSGGNFSGLMLSHNYWGTTDVNDIIARTNFYPGESSRLYPIISTADYLNADIDGDGVPDRIDSDNDNDGYSDIQEEKESDPLFGLIYNPLDNLSHPTSAYDSDFDGIEDVIDGDDDNDGLSDLEEQLYMTDSLLADSDDDLIPDGFEVKHHYDPLDETSVALYGVMDGVVVNSDYANQNNEVVIAGGTELRNCIVDAGTTIIIDNSASPIISGCRFNGAMGDVISIKGGGDVSEIQEINFKFNYLQFVSIFNMTMHEATFTGNEIRRSNVELSRYLSYVEGLSYERHGILGIVQSGIYDSHIFSSGHISIANRVDHSYIHSDASVSLIGDIQNSYLIGGRLACYENYGGSYGSYQNSVVSGSILSASSVDLSGCNVRDSLMSSSGYFGLNSNTLNSMVNSDLSAQTFSSSMPLFIDGVAIAFDNVVQNTGLGSPVDQVGDGTVDTVININGADYMVDGVTNPRATLNFPNGAADLWDPGFVGTGLTAPVP